MDDVTPRFFIALMAPDEVTDYANTVIQDLGDRYHTRTAHAPPHITLQAPFRWPKIQIATLEHCLRQFKPQFSLIPIQLSGFGHFGQRVLYIHVCQTSELMALQADLSHHLAHTLGIVDPKAKTRSFTPHMTVASRHLTPQSFRHAWHELSQRSVEFEYESDRLTLLIYQKQQWWTQATIAFTPS